MRLTAGLLCSLYVISGQCAVLYAAAGYLLQAVLIVPYALTFPGMIDADGFIGNEQSAAFLWLAWHLGFPLIVLVGDATRNTTAPPLRGKNVTQILGLTLLVAAVATVSVTLGRDRLPTLVDNRNFTPLFCILALGASASTSVRCSACCARDGSRSYAFG